MDQHGDPGPIQLEQLFPGDSELARRMRAFDWSKTDLGPPETWPQNLRLAVSLCLTSRFPILLWWGPNFTVLYNDAYIPFLGEAKHPRYLGGAGRDCWAEIWNVIEPMLESVRATGQATWSDAFPFFFERKLPREEVYVRFTYSPILASDGRTVDGIFTPCTEITDEIIGARRLETLRKLSAQGAAARSIPAACSEAARVFGENPDDVPFVALYVADRQDAALRLQAAVYPDGDHRLPETVTAAVNGSPWPFGRVLAGGGSAVVQLDSLGLRLSGRRWPDPVGTAVILPVAAAQNSRSGLLVFGTSPRRPLDSSYTTFFELAATHVAAAIRNALGYEDERRRAEALAELDRAKTAFFSNISHEFRTPLTLMLGPLEELQKQADGSVVVSGADLDLIHRNTRRLFRLVNSLLDFSRIEAGRMEAAYEPTDLARLTTELASIFQSAAEKAGLKLTIACPPLFEPVFVDRSMWENIVLNLVSNALKYTFQGNIKVALKQVGSRVELAVSDTGIGIPKDELGHIFDRFYRVNGGGGRTHEGSGIGLALVRDLVALHSGTVAVESTPGEGSRFTVSIPLGRSHLPAEHVRSPKQPENGVSQTYADEAQLWITGGTRESPPKEPPQAHGARPRILIVDDNPDMRRYLSGLLTDSYEVEEAPDGEAALAMTIKAPPDLIISDVMMPRMDGLALLRALRSEPRVRGVPFVLLSARAGDESTAEGLLAGADDYLIKPFSARELLSRISARLDLARMHREVLEREAFIEQIAELTPVVIRVFDVEKQRDTYLSKDVVALTGYTPEELSAMRNSFAEMTHPEDLAAYSEKLAGLKNMADGEIFEMEYRSCRRDGEWRWFSSRVMPFSRSGNGDVREVIAATVDITARKQAAEALRSSEERFRRIFELGLIGMAITSPEKGIVAANDEMCKILGYQRSELLGKTWAELTHPDDLPADVTRFERVMAGEISGYSMEKRWIRSDGHVIHSNISAKCVRREDGTIDYFVALLQDTTALKLSMDALHRAHADLEKRIQERTGQLETANEGLRREIAERKRVEEKLREYEKCVEGLDEMIVVIDRDYRYLLANRAFLKYRAMDRENLVGKLAPDLLNPGVFEQIAKTKLDEALRGKVVKYELKYNYGNLGEKDLAISYFPIEGESGVDRVACVLQDITERKRAEAELAHLRDELADDLEAMTRLHHLSTRMLQASGLGPLLEEALSATIELQHADFGTVQLYNPETQTLDILVQHGFGQEFLDSLGALAEDSSACGRALRSRERVVIEDVETDPGLAPYRQMAASAGVRAVQSTPLLSRRGEPLGMLSTHFRHPHRPSERDLRLTDLYARQAAEMIERKQAEEALRRSEAYLVQAQKLSHTGSWAMSRANGELFWSEEHFRILGLDPKSAIPAYPESLSAIYPEDRSRVETILESAFREGTNFEAELRIVRPDGTVRHIRSLAEPVFNEAGVITEYVGTIIDNTDRKLAAEAFHRLQSDVAHVARVTALGELAATIAHEVNQPLGAIANNCNVALRLMRTDSAAGEELKKVFSDILSDSNRASAIIARMRGLMKRVAPTREPLQISDVVRDVLALTEREFAERRIAVRFEIADDVRPVFGDRVQLQQLILNLVMNAAEAMTEVPEERRTVDITAASSDRNGEPTVLLSVRDCGCGFAVDNPERLFDALYTTKAGGMGMGLRISRSIAEAHGGYLWAEANTDAGATFFVFLPASRAM